MYLNDVECVCKDIEVGVKRPFAFKDLNWIESILLEYIRLSREKEKAYGDFISMMNSLPLTDLKVSLLYWVKKNILKQKEGGKEMIDKCIEECKTNIYSNIK
jgi:hypothetical protein